MVRWLLSVLALGTIFSPNRDALEAQSGFTVPVVVTSENTAEPGLEIAPGGLLYIHAPAGLLSNLPGSASFLFRSADGGATWIQTRNGLRDLFPGGGDADAAIDPTDGTIYFADLWLGSSTVSVSRDDGQSWITNPLDGSSSRIVSGWPHLAGAASISPRIRFRRGSWCRSR